MNIKEYLFYKNLSLKDFAKIVDVSACHLSSVITGFRKTSPKLLRAIERASDGWVKPDTAFAETKLPEGFIAGPVIPFPVPEPAKEEEPIEKFG